MSLRDAPHLRSIVTSQKITLLKHYYNFLLKYIFIYLFLSLENICWTKLNCRVGKVERVTLSHHVIQVSQDVT